MAKEVQYEMAEDFKIGRQMTPDKVAGALLQGNLLIGIVLGFFEAGSDIFVRVAWFQDG